MTESSKSNVALGVAWYRPEQWDRLLEVSVDRNHLEPTHGEWKKHAEKLVKRMRREGYVVRRVDVDVEELLGYCKERGVAVDAKARADFAEQKLMAGGGEP